VSQRKSLELCIQTLGAMDERMDNVEASIKGIHRGIADMHRDLDARLSGLEVLLGEVRGMLTNHQTASTAIHPIMERLSVLEEFVGIPHGGGRNGSSPT
jgi:hypothetical protein